MVSLDSTSEYVDSKIRDVSENESSFATYLLLQVDARTFFVNNHNTNAKTHIHKKHKDEKRSKSEEATMLVRTLLLSSMMLCISSVHALSASIFPAMRLFGDEEQDGTMDDEEEGADIPATLEESAFDTELYHVLQEPYASYKCLPSNLHLSQTTDIDPSTETFSYTISFTLDRDHCKNVLPKVLYGESGTEPREATAERIKFDFTSSTTNEHFESDWIYHVEMTGLKAGLLKYTYQIVVVDDDDDEEAIEFAVAAKKRQRGLLRGKPRLYLAETPLYTFTTAPLPSSPTTIALVGDLGQTTDSTKTMANILADTQHTDTPVSMVMIVGDMSYADSNPHRWTSWMELMEPLFRQTPLEVAAGNHEIECDKKTLDVFVQYEHYFRNANRLGSAETEPISPHYRKRLHNAKCSNPSQFSGHYNYGNAFYAYQHGMVQMIVLSSYSDAREGSPQYTWLKGLLQSVDRRVTPWVVVSFHCPFYTTFDGHDNEEQSQRMKEAMEPLFVEYGVNVVFSGHDHAYMRSHPMVDGKVKKEGPMYVIVGAGGNREGHSDYLHKHPEKWVAVRDVKEYGYGHFHAYNATHAHFHWVRDGNHKHGVKDHVWIENTHTV